MEFMLPFPPSVNGLFTNVKGVGRVKSKSYLKWLREANICANRQTQLSGISPYNPVYTGPVEVHYILCKPTKRISDIDNHAKACGDFMTNWGILKDDSQISKMTLEWGEGNGVFITIKLYVPAK